MESDCDAYQILHLGNNEMELPLIQIVVQFFFTYYRWIIFCFI